MVSDPIMRCARQQSWLRKTYRRHHVHARVSSDGFDARLRKIDMLGKTRIIDHHFHRWKHHRARAWCATKFQLVGNSAFSQIWNYRMSIRAQNC